MRGCFRLAAAVALTASLWGQAKPEKTGKKDVAGFANGAVVISYTDQYSDAYSALNLIDEDPALWSSLNGGRPPHEFVIELPQRYRLETITLDNTNDQEDGYPGISAKDVEVWLSDTSAKAGFRKVASAVAQPRNSVEVPLPAGSVGRWLKLVITSNHGNGSYTELSEARAFGEPLGAAAPMPKITGSYQTNYGPLYLTDTAGRITGCYPSGTGVVIGATDGRSLHFEWRQGDRVGTSTMVLNGDGSMLNGYWYEAGARQGMWYGHRTSDRPGTCAQVASVGSSLAASGRAVLYGIHFDSDKAVLRPDSNTTLEEVLAVMKDKPGMKLRVEGYTDSTNTDAYNLDLSKRRAAAVVAWLAGKGIAVGRLSAEGFGKAKPVADNTTPQGRALNRRVEISVVK
jgi:outer membrane protein OmpA-like peptidoglycan-associated protein